MKYILLIGLLFIVSGCTKDGMNSPINITTLQESVWGGITDNGTPISMKMPKNVFEVNVTLRDGEIVPLKKIGRFKELKKQLLEKG